MAARHAKTDADKQQTTDSGGAATAVLDPPSEAVMGDEAAVTFDPPEMTADTPAPPNPLIAGKAAWAGEHISYLFDPETRELDGATVTVRYDDGDHHKLYTAQIRRDGGHTWAWWEGETFVGSHQSTIWPMLQRAIEKGRSVVYADEQMG